jgi:hypothetical protein
MAVRNNGLRKICGSAGQLAQVRARVAFQLQAPLRTSLPVLARYRSGTAHRQQDRSGERSDEHPFGNSGWHVRALGGSSSAGA